MMMKKTITRVFIGAVLIISISASAQDSLFISEVADPLDDYSGRFIELFNAGSLAVDFSTSVFYLSRQSNGGTSWGDVQLTGTVAAGEAYVIGGSAFASLYGFTPDLETGILIGNGDDTYAIFRDGDHSTGVVHDIFGVIGVDGTGEPWEYEDSRAERVEEILVPNSTWTAAEWEIVTAGIADCDPGTHNGSSVSDTVPPPGDYSIAIQNETAEINQVVEVIVSVGELTASDNIISYQFDLGFESSVLEYSGYSVEGTLADGGTLAVNSGQTGTVSVSYMNSSAIIGEGVILVLQFNSLAVDTSDLILSNAYLNNIPVQNITNGSVIIIETEPPTAAIGYSDTVNRYADTLIITATFSESMDPEYPVELSFTGAATLTGADMTRLNDTLYSFLYPIPKASGDVYVGLSGGIDLWGNEVVPVPTSGEIFNIIEFTPGDVNDDGMIQAYDAALTLQYSVGLDPLPGIDPLPWENWRDSTANVDGTGGITAFDAGMILQYSAGIISNFSSPLKKSVSAADVTIEVKGNHIIFSSQGDLIGLNISTIDENHILGFPELLAEDYTTLNPSGFISAMNIMGETYHIGLCTAISPADGSGLLKIPFQKSGSVTFEIIANTLLREETVDLLTGRDEKGKEQIVIYPNPVSDILNIGGLTEPVAVRIYNSHGQLVIIAEVDNRTREIDLSNMPAGLYLIMLETNKKSMARRFLIR